MKASILTIGDEILIGQIVDTNSASIARHLNNAGIVVWERTSVGDQREQITEAFRMLKARGAEEFGIHAFLASNTCLLYTSDAADEL